MSKVKEGRTKIVRRDYCLLILRLLFESLEEMRKDGLEKKRKEEMERMKSFGRGGL